MNLENKSTIMQANKEQIDWLIANGFVEIPCEYKLIYRKQLTGDDREMQFSLYGSTCIWSITIYEGEYSECTLVSNIPNDANFNQFLPLIEMIR